MCFFLFVLIFFMDYSWIILHKKKQFVLQFSHIFTEDATQNPSIQIKCEVYYKELLVPPGMLATK